MKALLIFLGVALTDAVWTWYISGVGQVAFGRSIFWSGVLMAVGGLVTISYVNDHWLLVPAVLGAMTGTGVGLYVESKRTKKAPTTSC